MIVYLILFIIRGGNDGGGAARESLKMVFYAEVRFLMCRLASNSENGATRKEKR